MSRGNRWQLVVLVASVALLVVTVLTRDLDAVKPAPTPTPTPTPIPEQRDRPALFTEALVGEVRKLNPLFAGANPVDRDISALIFEGLAASDAYGQIVPALAEGWTVSRDATVFTVTLREDALWQDGLPFTGADVMFTLNLLRAPGFGKDVPGLAELAAFWRTVEVEALDDYTIRFRLTQPLASFPDFLRLGILPAHALENAPPDALLTHPFNLSPIGTGPYQLEHLRVDGGRIAAVQLRRAPSYMEREDTPAYAIERIVFTLHASFDDALEAFERGEASAIGRVPTGALDRAAQIPDLALYTALEPAVGFVLLNYTDLAFFKDRRFRAALAFGLNSRALVAEHLGDVAVPAESPLLPGGWAWTSAVDWPAYDYETAKTLLERARLEEPAAFSLLCPDTLAPLAEDIAEAWAGLDVDVTVEQVDAETLRERVTERRFDAAIVELSLAGMADPDPYVFWHQGQIAHGQNYGAVDDGPISEALERARRDPNGVNRAAWYEEFQRLFADRVPAIPLYYPIYVYGVDSHVEGVQLGLLSSPSDRFRSLWQWTYPVP